MEAFFPKIRTVGDSFVVEVETELGETVLLEKKLYLQVISPGLLAGRHVSICSLHPVRIEAKKLVVDSPPPFTVRAL